MKKIAFVLLLFSVDYAAGQLMVNTSLTPAQLMQSFIGGGVTISNISYTGGAASRGSFANGNATNLGLSDGIILCTGNTSLIANPATYFMSNNLGLAGDANLNSINNGTNTFDASVLQFDFVPISDSVKFKYVFGSEEYPNYICSQYNDVFAFFISGPNPSGGSYTNYNIALIPGTNIPVSVNSVNSGTPGSGFSSSGCTSLAYSNLYVNNALINGTTIAFGGFTTPLVANCKVIPCQTYHMKLAVADGYNGLYDSGVFLQANSFSSNTFTVNSYYTDTILGNNAIEGCSEGVVTFTTPQPVTSPFVINYTISGSAVNGTDYTPIPSSLTIPAGQDSVALIIHPLTDAITEGTETVFLNITNGCITIKDTINIIDKVPLSIDAGTDVVLCQGETAQLSAATAGGLEPFTFTWSPNAGSTDSTAVSPSATTTYTVTVSDHCATAATDAVLVTVNPYPVLSVNTSSQSVCGGQSVTLSASGANSYTWMPGNHSGASITESPANSTTYTVIGTAGGNCNSSATVSIEVTNIGIAISTVDEHCGHYDGSASASITGNCTGSPSYSWSSAPSQNIPSIENLAAGNYSVTVSCGGCSNTAAFTIVDNPGVAATFSATPQVTSITNSTISFFDNTQGAIHSWLWDLGDGTSATTPSFQHTYDATGTYLVTMTVTDIYGCSGSVSLTITVEDACVLFIPNAFTPNNDGVNDLFTPIGINIAADRFQMVIYDRWGVLVYQTNKWLGTSCEGWDGTRGNTGDIEKAVTGEYSYLIFAGNHIDGFKTYTGGITLIH